MQLVEDKSVLQMQQATNRLLQRTPALAEKIRRPNSGPKITKKSDKDTIIMELQRQLEEEKDKNNTLEDQFKYRVGSFVKREAQARKTIETLETQLQAAADDDHQRRMGMIRNLHDSVIGTLENVQNNTARNLQDQERDLMRAFRARLQDVSKELEAHRNKKGDQSAELAAKHRRVVNELHASQELAQVLDRKNQALAAENTRLQEKLQTREDDRQSLLKELSNARKDITKLKNNLEEQQDVQPRWKSEVVEPVKKRFSKKSIDQAKLQQNRNRQYERELSYRDAIEDLKRSLASEKRTLRMLQEISGKQDAARSELEMELRRAIDQVLMEMCRRRECRSDPLPPIGPPIQPSIHDMVAADRERVLEVLLSSQHVVQMLYDNVESYETQEEFSWANDVLPEINTDLVS